MLNWREYKHVTEPYWTKDEFGLELNTAQMWEDFMEQFGAYPDDTGNIWFDTEEGEAWFMLKFAKNDNTVGG
jgi:hypothetical protein